MNYENIIFSFENRIAKIIINRPNKLNALNKKTKLELKNIFSFIKTSNEIDIIIITGSGEKAFIAGTDIEELKVLNKISGKKFAIEGENVFREIQNLGKPVIAAINGYALGGGLELTLSCHIRIASENAKFGQPEVNLGIIPGYGGTQRLTRIVGVSKAMEMILTGSSINANEALCIGLISKIVPQNELLKTCEEIANTIISKGQFAIRMALKSVNSTMETNLTDGLELEANLFSLCCETNDMKEGVNAFLEKRKPNFLGK